MRTVMVVVAVLLCGNRPGPRARRDAGRATALHRDPVKQRPARVRHGRVEVSAALRQPLQYVSGASGSEVYLALRNQGGSGLINHRDRLFLQFRNGRLDGWKEDYGRNWMWR